MLMQLVCVDRRYQRMNCFNIRELQGILKRRFFSDLVNSADHRDLLSSSMIGLRFKSNNAINIDHDTLSFFKLGTNNSAKSRSSDFSNYYSDFLASANNTNSFKANLSFSNPSSYFISLFVNFASNIISLFSYSPLVALSSLVNYISFSSFMSLIQSNLLFTTTFSQSTSQKFEVSTSEGSARYTSTNVLTGQSLKYSFMEQESLSRFSRFSNPIVSYDYKCGNYIGI